MFVVYVAGFCVHVSLSLSFFAPNAFLLMSTPLILRVFVFIYRVVYVCRVCCGFLCASQPSFVFFAPNAFVPMITPLILRVFVFI